MIISTEKNFVFIHIPKNAGSNIRNQIKLYDDFNEEFNQIILHPVLGHTYTSHLTLSELKYNYPEPYRLISELRSIAILRDPYERFTSCLNQRLREFKGMAQSEITQSVLEAEAKEVLSQINGKSSDELPLELIHFRKQKDFVFDSEGRQVIDNLFKFDELDQLVQWFDANTGIKLELGGESSKYNATLDVKSKSLKSIIVRFKPLINLIPDQLKDKIRDFLIYIGIYGRTNKTTAQLLIQNQDISKSVDDYYGQDIALYHSVSNLNLVSA